ncbi:hypothetical protein GJAV_G00027600 [Gymnothorax javanicus]|nr:hypothetical protein GJAV_G00027600 [Gymnothorax javanicus]
MSKISLNFLIFFSLALSTDCEETIFISDGGSASILCNLYDPSTVLWFRVGNTGIDIIGYVDSKGTVNNYHDKKGTTIESKKQLNIKKFNKERDSGVYGCSTTQGQNLSFGGTTILAGSPDPTTTTTPVVTTATPLSTTTTPCPCKTSKRPDSAGNCEVAILAPLIAGCILLFLILILTIRHCSRVRTRGCPHHYKRRPNRHI